MHLLKLQYIYIYMCVHQQTAQEEIRTEHINVEMHFCIAKCSLSLFTPPASLFNTHPYKF